MPLNRLDTQDPPILYIYDLSIKNPSSTIPYEALLSLKSCNMPYAHRKWIKDALKSGLDKVLPLMTSPPTIVIAPNHIVGPNHSALAEAINDILPSLPPNSHKDGIGMLVRTREVAQQSLFTKNTADNLLRTSAMHLNSIAVRDQFYGKPVLVVDDVVVSGSTMRAVFAKCREAGCSEIWGLAIAK